MRVSTAAGMIVVLSLACVDLTGPSLPAADRFDPPAAYHEWWEQIAACSRRSRDFGAVGFYRVRPAAGEDSLTYRDRRTGRWYYGEWDPSSNSIYIAWGQLSSSNIVRHEMLHAVLRRVDHPAPYFDDACGPLVAY